MTSKPWRAASWRACCTTTPTPPESCEVVDEEGDLARRLTCASRAARRTASSASRRRSQRRSAVGCRPGRRPRGALEALGVAAERGQQPSDGARTAPVAALEARRTRRGWTPSGTTAAPRSASTAAGDVVGDRGSREARRTRPRSRRRSRRRRRAPRWARRARRSRRARGPAPAAPRRARRTAGTRSRTSEARDERPLGDAVAQRGGPGGVVGRHVDALGAGGRDRLERPVPGLALRGQGRAAASIDIGR